MTNREFFESYCSMEESVHGPQGPFCSGYYETKDILRQYPPKPSPVPTPPQSSLLPPH